MNSRSITIKKICKLNRETIRSNNHLDYINYLDTGNITRNKIDEIKKLVNGVDKIPSRAQRKVQKNTIIYSTVRPEQEHFGIIENPIDNLIVSTGFTTLDVIDETIDSKYLYYSLTNKIITEYLNIIAANNVTSYPSLNPSDIGNLVFEIPIRKTDQQKIAKVLSDLDAKIELNNKINAELEAMAKTLYDYWFVQFDFPDANGKPYKTSGGKMVWNEELKREIPEGWEVMKINEISTIKAGGDKPKIYSNQKSKTYSIPIYSNGITNDGLYGYTNEAKIHSQSITISARGTIGFCVLRNHSFVPIIRLIVVIPNEIYSTKYLFETIKNIAFEKSGSVQQQLTAPQVSQIDILYPSTNILKKFDEITSFSIYKIELIKEENQELASLRNWLLPMLMNGQVTVNNSEEHLEIVTESNVEYKKI